MAAVFRAGRTRALHPVHAILLAFPFPLFLGGACERRCLLGNISDPVGELLVMADCWWSARRRPRSAMGAGRPFSLQASP